MSRHGKHTIFMMDLWAIVPYYTAYLSKALIAAGVDVMVGSISYYLDPECFRSRGLHLEPGLLDIVGKQPNLPPALRRSLKLIEALINMVALTVRFLFRPPMVVHVQFLPLLRWKIPVERWFLSFCRWRGAKIVLTVHDLLPHDTAERYRELFASLYSSVDHLICHSESVRTRLSNEFGIQPDKVSVIPHGPFFYDLPADPATISALKSSPDEVLVLWQGIIFPYKGVDVLLQAWQTVEQATSHARLLIVGTGSPELLQQLQTQASNLKLQHVTLDFRFISPEELTATYQGAEVIVYPYNAITTSGALATGLALGKCIVASDLPVFRELLHDGENSLLVTPRDPEALAVALTRTINDPSLRDRFASKVLSMNFGDDFWLSIAKKTAIAYISQ